MYFFKTSLVLFYLFFSLNLFILIKLVQEFKTKFTSDFKKFRKKGRGSRRPVAKLTPKGVGTARIMLMGRAGPA